MEGLFLKLLNMSISAGWVILAVILLRVFLKKGPKWIRCILWGIVGIRLICPFSLESVFSLIPSAETIPQEILLDKTPEIDSGVRMVNSVINPVLSGSFAPNPGDSVNPLQVLAIVAAWIWTSGMVAMVLYAFISYIRLRRRVAVSMCVAENIYICDYIDTPFILGIVKPRIYLPSTLEEERVPYVLSHERAHLKRRDHFWKPLGYLILMIYWFQPLVWVAYALLCRDIELACDEKVIKELGEAEKKSYSDALLECSVPRKWIVACPLAFGEVGVKERVKTVLHYKRPGFWIMLAAVVACLVTAVCFLTNPKEKLLHAPEPLCHTYRIEESAYVYGKELISSVLRPIDYARYCFTADYLLFIQRGMGMDDGSTDWVQAGAAREITLTEDNFDAYFKDWDGMKGMPLDFSAKKYRKENASAWQVLREDGELSYYLLQQKNGDVYLVLWYCDSERESNPGDDDSYVRWMFKMDRTDYVTANLKSPGKNSFFELSWYPEGWLADAYEEVQVIEAAERGRLEFTVDGSPKELSVKEEYYDSQGNLVKTGSYTLMENMDGVYALDISETEEGQEAYAMYYVTYRGGKYVCKLNLTANPVLLSTAASGESEKTTVEEPAEVDSVETDSLEEAIHDAILGTDAERTVEGVRLFCESHVILGTETLCAVPKADGTGGGEYLTVYAMVLKQDYVFGSPNGEIIGDGGSHMPVAITFKVEEDEYILEEYWLPEDGSYYEPTIREKFPDDIEEEALDTQKYICAQMQDCYQQAIAFAGTDTEAVLKELIDDIISPPRECSIETYIRAEPMAYREMLYYGMSTLAYCMNRFEEGGQTGIEGMLLALVSQDIARSYGIAQVYANWGSNPQEWYDGYGLDAIFVPLGLTGELP
ncbi:MAG: hypothetical protein IJZ82_09960 [Lachnospiraceae bacterium]|nr:hypothetical protein [Lachnospiraceae bacterium]